MGRTRDKVRQYMKKILYNQPNAIPHRLRERAKLETLLSNQIR